VRCWSYLGVFYLLTGAGCVTSWEKSLFTFRANVWLFISVMALFMGFIHYMQTIAIVSALALWWSAAVLSVSSASDHVLRQNDKKPNFIIFLMDDVRVSCIVSAIRKI